jgi:hypothetical protein
MPQDLEAEKPEPAVTLTESPNNIVEAPKPEEDEIREPQREFVIVPQDQQYKGPSNLHPYTRPLTISDLESVVALENAAFPDPRDRATREKVSPCFRSSTLIFTRDPSPPFFVH